MEPLIKVIGAKALIYLRYPEDIYSLASMLSVGLQLPEFRVETRESPPHDLTGMAEALGWEVWLDHTDAVRSFQYSLAMETSNVQELLDKSQMYDLSPWLAKYVSRICKVDAFVGGTKIVFCRGIAKQMD